MVSDVWTTVNQRLEGCKGPLFKGIQCLSNEFPFHSKCKEKIVKKGSGMIRIMVFKGSPYRDHKLENVDVGRQATEVAQVTGDRGEKSGDRGCKGSSKQERDNSQALRKVWVGRWRNRGAPEGHKGNSGHLEKITKYSQVEFF